VASSGIKLIKMFVKIRPMAQELELEHINTEQDNLISMIFFFKKGRKTRNQYENG
jgi:hypothetical protein